MKVNLNKAFKFTFKRWDIKPSMDTTSHNGDLKRIVTSDILTKIRKSSQIGFNQPFEFVDSVANHSVFRDTTIFVKGTTSITNAKHKS